MRELNVIAIDLVKTIFQVCKTDSRGRVIFNKSVSRQGLKSMLSREKASLIAMESCSGSHYWMRYAKSLGHHAKSYSARQIKAFRQGQKTDVNDVLAISVAARQPQLKPSRAISLEDQCLQGMECMRDWLVKQKVSLGNQLRGLLLELGYTIAQGDRSLRQAMPSIIEEMCTLVPASFRSVFHLFWEHYLKVLEDIRSVERLVFKQVNQDNTCQRLQALEGVGPVSALRLKVVLSTPEHFRNGREASACLGVTPVQHSSGGKERIGSISKVSANQKLRSDLFKGAMSVIAQLEKRSCRTQKEVWLRNLVLRRGKKVAAIALANKTVRTAYALIRDDQCYQPSLVAA